MRDEVKTVAEDDKVKGALYASLFGLSNIEQIKMKLIQSAVPAMEANPGLWDGAKQVLSSSVKVLEGFLRAMRTVSSSTKTPATTSIREKTIRRFYAAKCIHNKFQQQLNNQGVRHGYSA